MSKSGLLIAAIAAGGLGIGWYSHMTRKHGLGPLLWRWHTGMPLDNYHRTNARWTKRSHGDKPVLHPTGHAVWFWHQARLLRAAIRCGGTYGTAFVVWAWLFHRAALIHTGLAFAAVFVGYLGWRVYGLVYGWKHHWRWHRPLRHKLTRELAVRPPSLEVARDRSEVTIGLPDDFLGTPAQKDMLGHIVESTLAIEAPKPAWKLDRGDGKKPQVIFTKSEPPPASVSLADILPHIRAAAEHEVILGLGKKGEVITVSLHVDQPHVGYCMKSGRGKSVAAGNMAAQVLYHGGQVLFLDWKLTSHMWARGLPNVAYAGPAAEIHELLTWLAADEIDSDGNLIRECELTRRKNIVRATANLAGEVPADVDLGPRTLVVAEELNALQQQLKKLWRRMGGKGPSPAAEALDELMFTGREFQIHVLQIGQRLSAKATSGSGSADSRENLGGILFSNPSDSTWNLLTDRAAKPAASDHPGRHQWFTSDTVAEMQGVLYHPQKLRAAEMMRELATAGTVAVPRFDMPFVTRPAGVPVLVGHGDPRAMDASDQGNVVQHAALPPARDPGTVTLREAVEAGMWPTLHAARQAKQRYKPAPVGSDGRADLFRIEDLETCRAKRGQD